MGPMGDIIRSTNSVPDLDKTSSYQLVARAHKLGYFFVLLRRLLILRLLFGRPDRFVQLPFVYQGFRGRIHQVHRVNRGQLKIIDQTAVLAFASRAVWHRDCQAGAGKRSTEISALIFLYYSPCTLSLIFCCSAWIQRFLSASSSLGPPRILPR